MESVPIDFNYQFYLETYPDLRHFSEDEARKHYVELGRKEGRICAKIPFDYKFYLETYPDLRHFSEEQARKHFLVCGRKEGRIAKTEIPFDYQFYSSCYPDLRDVSPKFAYKHFSELGRHEGRMAKKQLLNTTTHITIIIHLFFDDLFEEMVGYINNVKDVFSNVNVIFTVRKDINIKKAKYMKNKLPEAIFIKVENKGVDVYPFIVSMKFLRRKNIKTDYVLKLHSKKTSNKTEGCINWRQNLIVPIVKYQNLAILQHYFKKIDNLGYVSSQLCVLPKNFDFDFPQNIQGVKQICDKFPHLEKEWTDFNAGNMFWISNKVLDQYLTEELMEHIMSHCVEGKPPPNLTDKGIHIEYICERLFTGIFCYDKTNLHVNEYTMTQRGVSVENGNIDHRYFYQPRIISLSIPKQIINYVD